ncbi:MAG: TetR family transcriptional regulator [Micromonosporaceae bacterium]|nr:TetR family transcriptional regulator [Micromonosporaceae bacterium]
MARTGRRRGSPDTREAIVSAARAVFAEHGYDGAAIRAIAARAGVDPALVHHYFGTKEKLFLAVVAAPFDPGEVLPRITGPGTDGFGERLIRALLAVWEDPVRGPAALALLRSALRHDWSARMLREFLTNRVLRRGMQLLEIDPAEAPLRASLVASQIVGLVGIRYALRIEPLASLPVEVVVANVGPTIQRYVTGPLVGRDAVAIAEHLR